MNRLAFVLISMAMFSTYAKGDTKFWVDEPEKVVLVAANPTLNVTLVKLEVDDDYYARLDVSLNYVSGDIKSQVDSVMKPYGGYLLQRVVVQKNGTYRYQIPILGVSRDVDSKSGVEGPYFEEQIYVNKLHYQALQAEIAGGRPVVQISGSLIGTVALMKVVERKEIAGSICDTLLGADKTVGSTVSKVATGGLSALDSIQFQFDSTKNALLRDIKDNCFEVAKSVQVDSFADLISVVLKTKSLNRNLFGETLKKSYDRIEIPLAFETHQSGGK